MLAPGVPGAAGARVQVERIVRQVGSALRALHREQHAQDERRRGGGPGAGVRPSATTTSSLYHLNYFYVDYSVKQQVLRGSSLLYDSVQLL